MVDDTICAPTADRSTTLAGFPSTWISRPWRTRCRGARRVPCQSSRGGSATSGAPPAADPPGAPPNPPLAGSYNAEVGRSTVIVRAVLFDLDDTLFDHEYCSRSALEAVQASHDCFAGMRFEALEGAARGV